MGLETGTHDSAPQLLPGQHGTASPPPLPDVAVLDVFTPHPVPVVVPPIVPIVIPADVVDPVVEPEPSVDPALEAVLLMPVDPAVEERVVPPSPELADVPVDALDAVLTEPVIEVEGPPVEAPAVPLTDPDAVPDSVAAPEPTEAVLEPDANWSFPPQPPTKSSRTNATRH